MTKDVFTQNNLTRAVSDRQQRVAFWVCVIGLIANTVLFALYAVNDEVSGLLVFNYVFYTLVILTIAWSSYRNRYFSVILSLGIGSIYVHMWGTTFADAILGQASNLSFPTLLFAPLFLVLIMGYRLLLFSALVQGFAVFLYAKLFVPSLFGIDPSLVDATTFALHLGILSCLSLMVLAAVAYARDRTDKRLLSLINHTERLAAQDPLTGLKNRRAFLEDVETLWVDETRFAVLFIDLDRFKPLNDEYGHAVGDAVLHEIGQRLEHAPGVCSAARFGGDEFAAVLEGSDLDFVEAMIDQIYTRITAEIDVDVATVTVGASLGYALAFTDSTNVSDLLHAADTAMMRSKTNSSGVSKFDRAQDNVSVASAAIGELFRTALGSGHIKAALQPILDSNGAQTVGHELFARWQNSGLQRDLSPIEFIPIAEKLGLLNDLLWRTLDQAIPEIESQPGFLAINVSPAQLSSRSFVTDLRKKAGQHQFPMDRLEIEVTEQVAHRNLPENIEVLMRLRALGCRIVLDDFGAGNSSLSLLDQLPLDKVKLDKSLQETMHTDGVLRATVRLVTDLGFDCCIEGVETEAIFNRVSNNGCHQVQGFWFGVPEIVKSRPRQLRLVS